MAVVLVAPSPDTTFTRRLSSCSQLRCPTMRMNGAWNNFVVGQQPRKISISADSSSQSDSSQDAQQQILSSKTGFGSVRANTHAASEARLASAKAKGLTQQVICPKATGPPQRILCRKLGFGSGGASTDAGSEAGLATKKAKGTPQQIICPKTGFASAKADGGSVPTSKEIECSTMGLASIAASTDAALEAVLTTAKATGKTALCIWFHFLAGKGADWEHGLKAKIANQLPWVEWYFPDAPKKPVTNYDGAIERCWFDQLEGQATECMATPGLEVSVSMVHSLLRQAEAHGFASNRILLGGMSQGGVLAMTAGFSYDKQLAGIISVSAWMPPCLPGAMKQPNTPLMMANGDQDDVVPMKIVKWSLGKLEQAGCKRITKKIYPGLGHTWSDTACNDVKENISCVLPNGQMVARRASFAGLPMTAKSQMLRSP